MQGVPTRVSELPSYLLYILLNPTVNLRAAVLLYASIAFVLLIILVVGIMFLTRPAKGGASKTTAPRKRDTAGEKQFDRLAAGEPFDGLDGEVVIPAAAPPAPRPRDPRLQAVLVVAAIVVACLAWVATGYTTSDPGLCRECHWPASQHAKAPKGTDKHARVSCVACHESGGIVGRFVTGVPSRLIHFADSQAAIPLDEEYGRVTITACSSCHRDALTGVVTNETRALKVSHKEPLDASAACIDCHALRSGVVGAHNTGMGQCVRCHDAKIASERCDTCHDQRTATAARARTTSFADVQIPDVSCGGCHDEKKECDWCHGMRLPHPLEFKAYAHARAGAVDFWYTGGKVCSRCHNASRRPCQQCHRGQLGGAHGTGKTWLATGHQKAAVMACDTCHKQFAYRATRDFCKDVCHTPAAIAGSPR